MALRQIGSGRSGRRALAQWGKYDSAVTLTDEQSVRTVEVVLASVAGRFGQMNAVSSNTFSDPRETTY